MLLLIMMSYKLIQPAVSICISIGMADLIANIIVYLQYRQIVVYRYNPDSKTGHYSSTVAEVICYQLELRK